MTEAPKRPLERLAQRTPIEQQSASTGWGRRISLVLALLGSLSLAAGALVWAQDASTPEARDADVVAHDAFRIDYSDAPAQMLLNYTQGASVEYTLELTNNGPLPISIEGVASEAFNAASRLLRITGTRLADPVNTAATFEPFSLRPGESRAIIVSSQYDNCEYYTERAMDIIHSLPVTWSVLGSTRTTDVALTDELAVRSPYIRRCPGRVMDRGARSRTGSS